MTEHIEAIPLDDRTERARAAVKVFRTMQPQLTAYARAITKRKDLRVQLATSGKATAFTDGKDIFFIPPISLGDQRPHVRELCDKRDSLTGEQRCRACRAREEVLAVIYHEMAHICYNSFDPVTETDKVEITLRAVQEGGTKFAKVLQERYDSSPSYMRNSYQALSALFNDFLPLLTNALEDARVNREMFESRRGTKAMFEARSRKSFVEGVEQRNRQGEIVKVLWLDYPLNLQAIIGCYCKVSGYDYRGWFHPKVEADLDDPGLTEVLSLMSTVRGPGDVYNLSFRVLEQLRRLGYCKTDNDPEPDEEPEDEQEEATEEPPAESPAADSEDDDADSDGSEEPEDQPASESEPADDSEEESDPHEPDEDAGESGGDAGDDPGDDGDGDGDAESDASDDAGGDDAGEEDGPGGTGEPGTEASEGDEPDGGTVAQSDVHSGEAGKAGPPDSEADPDDGEEEAGSGGSDSLLRDPSGADAEPLSDGEDGTEVLESPGEEDAPPADQREASNSTGGDKDAPSDESLGGLTDGGSDTSGDTEDIPSRGEVGSDSQHLPGGGESVGDDDAQEAPVEASEGGDRVSDDRDSDSPSPDDERSPEGDAGFSHVTPDEATEPIDTGADQGVGGISVEELVYGSAGDIEEELAVLLGHGELDQVEKAQVLDDSNAVVTAVVQGAYFETPSERIIGVREWEYDKIPQDFAMAWRPGAPARDRAVLGIDAELDVPEQVLGGALMRMRVAFTDNKRAAHARNLKSGKVDARVLGKRASLGDERLFKKTTQPGKKDYFVGIALDVSGSTAGVNIGLMRRAVMAQATLLDRMGIKFAVFAHSGSSSSSGSGTDMDIFWIKKPNEPWSEPVQNRLRELGPGLWNLDGHAMEFLRKMLDRESATNKIALYYSDGKMPAFNHDEELTILQREITMCARLGYTLLGVGIRTDSPERHGLPTVQVDTDEDLVKVVRHIETRLTKGR